MRFAVPSLTLLAALALAACANNPNRPSDTGSMQQPAATGGTNQVLQRTPDTGSMQQHMGSGGTARPVGRATPTDTGSMQAPSRRY